jgi:ABC-type uncharacterized transport system fused permease/ATPase subunit
LIAVEKSILPLFLITTIAVAAVAMVVYIAPINFLAKLQFNGDAYEGDFRWTHSRIVRHSESIAFYKGEESEEKVAGSRFDKIYANFIRLILAEAVLGGFLAAIPCLGTLVAFGFLYLLRARIQKDDVFALYGFMFAGILVSRLKCTSAVSYN